MKTGAWVVGVPLVIATGLAVSVGSVFGSVQGWGLAEPKKEPLSIREGSIRQGKSKTSFFVTGGRGLRGGGLRGGK